MNAYKIAIEAIEAVNTGRINGREFEERIAPLRDVETVVHCKDCALNCFSPDHESVSYWIPCQEIKPEPHYFCWAGKQKAQKQN